MISYKGKEPEKEYTQIFQLYLLYILLYILIILYITYYILIILYVIYIISVTEPLCDTPEINTTLWVHYPSIKNKIKQ